MCLTHTRSWDRAPVWSFRLIGENSKQSLFWLFCSGHVEVILLLEHKLDRLTTSFCSQYVYYKAFWHEELFFCFIGSRGLKLVVCCGCYDSHCLGILQWICFDDQEFATRFRDWWGSERSSIFNVQCEIKWIGTLRILAYNWRRSGISAKYNRGKAEIICHFWCDTGCLSLCHESQYSLMLLIAHLKKKPQTQ